MVHSSKGLSVSLPCPPALAYMPGDVLPLTLRHRGSAPLASTFSSIVLQVFGLSVFQGGNLLSSRHIILDERQEIDLGHIGDTSEMAVNVVLPTFVACKCRKEPTVLPASAAIRMGPAMASSAAEGVEFLVGYRVEVIAKRKGWTKSAER